MRYAAHVLDKFVIITLAVATLAACRSQEDCPRPSEPAECPEARDRSEPRSSASASVAAPSSSAPPAIGSAEAPKGFLRVFVANLVSTEGGAAVLLAEDPSEDAGQVLAIFVGGTEGVSLALRISGERFPRPLTHDLLDRTLAVLGGKVVEVRITRIEGTTFIGALFIGSGGKVLELDARPSDAIALAIGSGAPIYVASEVMKKAGVDRKDLTDDSKTRKPSDPTFL